MRSRYTAYVRGAVDYLVDTHAAQTRGELDRAAIAAWSRATQWLGLEIVATSAGGETDDTGAVEFIARGITHGTPFAQRERSRFQRDAGRWYYVDGDSRAEPAPRGAPVTRAPTPGRNDPCACGSGRKYKKCHGA
jgi:SEC-C motif-containing protein